jgi:hypothetical protein
VEEAAPDQEKARSSAGKQRRFNGIVLSQEVNNVEGEVRLEADHLRLSDPNVRVDMSPPPSPRPVDRSAQRRLPLLVQNQEVVTTWKYEHLRSYGYIRSVRLPERVFAEPPPPVLRTVVPFIYFAGVLV